MKIYQRIKFFVFILSGILILIFSNFFMESINSLIILVSGIMIFYGLEGVIKLLIKKEAKQEKILFINQIITLLLGLILLLKPHNEFDLTILAVFWSVWAIMRESEEIYEKVFNNFDNKITCSLNFIESVVVIIFSILLIINPTEHHLHSHVILLSVELLLEVLFPLLNFLETKFRAKKVC